MAFDKKEAITITPEDPVLELAPPLPPPAPTLVPILVPTLEPTLEPTLVPTLAATELATLDAIAVDTVTATIKWSN